MYVCVYVVCGDRGTRQGGRRGGRSVVVVGGNRSCEGIQLSRLTDLPTVTSSVLLLLPSSAQPLAPNRFYYVISHSVHQSTNLPIHQSTNPPPLRHLSPPPSPPPRPPIKSPGRSQSSLPPFDLSSPPSSLPLPGYVSPTPTSSSVPPQPPYRIRRSTGPGPPHPPQLDAELCLDPCPIY